MRKPFKKTISDLPMENAHGGSGQRQLLLSKEDTISAHLHAMTKGYLEQNGIFDWHDHDKIDEWFLVLKGTGVIQFVNGDSMQYQPNDLIYVPANTKHRIENTGKDTNEFYFIRVDA